MTKEPSPRGHDTTPRIPSIAADLRARIASGELGPGDKLPSTKELAAHYEISPQAIARVIALLKAEGAVWSRQGAGVFVRSWEPLVYRPQEEFKQRAPDLDVFAALMSSEGRQGEQTIEVSTGVAEDPIRKRLQLPEGAMVAVRHRTSFLEGQPYFTDDSYVSLDIVRGSEWMTEGSVERGTNQVLAELGHELITALDEIYTRMPTANEMPRLGIVSGNMIPVIELISTGHDATGRPIQVTTNILPADRNVVVYERRRMAEES